MIHPLTRNGRAKHLSSRRPPCLSPHAERSKKGGRARRDRVAVGLYPKSAPEPGHRFNIARWRGSMRRASLVPGQFNDRPHAGKPGGQSQQQAGENVSDPFDVFRLSPVRLMSLACPGRRPAAADGAPSARDAQAVHPRRGRPANTVTSVSRGKHQAGRCAPAKQRASAGCSAATIPAPSLPCYGVIGRLHENPLDKSPIRLESEDEERNEESPAAPK